MTAQIQPKTRFTIHDLGNMPLVEGNRYEIIAGELIVSHQPHDDHQYSTANIIIEIGNWNKRAKLGRVLDAPGIIFDDENAVAPDVVWVSTVRRLAIERDGKLHGAPELAVEVLSPGTANTKRDKETKRDLYDTWGVTEYWIVSWQRKTVDVYRRNPESTKLEHRATLKKADTLDTPKLPGFACAISDFFGDLA